MLIPVNAQILNGRSFGRMIDGQSQSYFVRRAEQERVAALNSHCEQAARRHREMEKEYRRLALFGQTKSDESGERLDNILPGEFRLVP